MTVNSKPFYINFCYMQTKLIPHWQTTARLALVVNVGRVNVLITSTNYSCTVSVQIYGIKCIQIKHVCMLGK